MITSRRSHPAAPTHMLRSEDIDWTRTVQPRERYRILYLDRNGEQTERTIELQRIGHRHETPYLGVMDEGVFKTMRTDRVLAVLDQFTTGHAPSIFAAVTYATTLPHFPVTGCKVRVPTTHAHNPDARKAWTVDLDAYTCTCPERRRREPKGYTPGKVGAVCDHLAKAILAKLPIPPPAEWTPNLIEFLRNPQNTALSNLE